MITAVSISEIRNIRVSGIVRHESEPFWFVFLVLFKLLLFVVVSAILYKQIFFDVFTWIKKKFKKKKRWHPPIKKAK